MDDNSKNTILIPLIVAALTTMVAQFFFGGLPWSREAMLDFSYAKLFINIGIGLVAGGAAFGVLKVLGK